MPCVIQQQGQSSAPCMDYIYEAVIITQSCMQVHRVKSYYLLIYYTISGMIISGMKFMLYVGKIFVSKLFRKTKFTAYLATSLQSLDWTKKSYLCCLMRTHLYGYIWKQPLSFIDSSKNI